MTSPARHEPAANDVHRFQAVVRDAGEAVLVCLYGELDLGSADIARRALADASARGARVVVADLSNVALLDSTGLGVLLEAARARGPERFALICPGGLHARGVLSISGALDQLLVVESEEELAARLRGPADG